MVDHCKVLKAVAVIGHFAFGMEYLDGQTVKTKIVTDALCTHIGASSIVKFDTHGGWKSLLRAPFQSISALRRARNVIILPAHNGLRIYAPLLSVLRVFFPSRKLHYVVIGGWLPEFLAKRPRLASHLKRFDAIYVETSSMQRALCRQGFDNILVMPNCKELQILHPDELVYHTAEPYPLCTFSRVIKEKGIEDAVNAVKAVNQTLGRTAYTLDIYGPVAPEQSDWFAALQAAFPDFIHYRGSVPFDQTTSVLKDYFALLFPTHFYTEGIPGSIIDAYAAGIPVISAKWESFDDVISDGHTGIGYPFNEYTMFLEQLSAAVSIPDRIQSMKSLCIQKAESYLPDQALQPLFTRLTHCCINK